MKKIQTIFICTLLAACGAGNQAKPNSTLFNKPFQGDFRNSWPFDHKYPVGYFSDNCEIIAEDHALTWRDELLEIEWNTKCHNGYDWGLPEGTPLYAVADGEVVFAESEEPFLCNDKGEVSALIVRIRHSVFSDTDYETVYAHLSQVDVVEGQIVTANEQIGLSGSTGCVSGPHLHFAVNRLTGTNNGEKTAVDPFGWNGLGVDPWSIHPDGAESVFLWQAGKAPSGDYGEFRFRE